MAIEKWNVQLGDTVMSVSADLCKLLGFTPPYANAQTAQVPRNDTTPLVLMAEALQAGFVHNLAAIYAISLQSRRRNEQAIQTARQKVAELEAKAAEDHRVAEEIAIRRAVLEKEG